jgi:hypothetical protein
MESDKPDHFTLNPEELEDGAKVGIARLVDDKIKSINVPEIYVDVEQAIKSGKDIIIRSDHPEEYDGLAGVLRTIFTKRESDKLKFSVKNNNKFKDYFLSSSEDLDNLRFRIIDNFTPFKKYLSLTGRNKEEILDRFNFTIGEHIPGINGTMWADPVIPYKYHFLQNSNKEGNVFIKYTRLNISTGEAESNGTSGKLEDKLPGGMDTLRKLIDSYEEIRDLDQFNANHCYEMEYQIDPKGNNWFLQWRRMRDFTPTDFKLKRKLEAGEIEGSFAVGKTEENGYILKTQDPGCDEAISPDVEAITTMTLRHPSIKYPNMKVALYHHSSFNYFAIMILSHSTREAFGSVNLITHVPFKDKDKIDPFIARPLRYISDGERCLIKRM